MSYIGNEPIVSATRTVTEVTATAGQTVFNANGGYTVGYLDVFLNGSKLTTTDFTATNGSSITLTESAQVGDIVRLEAWGTFSTSTAVLRAGDTMTGALLLPDGSASAPALSNDGDTNTGIFFPAADTIAFAEGGAESMRIDSAGNVGINYTAMSSLGAKLYVYGYSGFGASANGSVSLGSRTNWTSTFENNAGGYGLGVNVNSSTGNVNIQSQRFDGTATAYDIALNPLGGNVGIGNSAPFNNGQYSSLTIGGLGSSKRGLIELKHSDNNARGYLYVTADQFLTLETSGAYPLLFSTNGAERMRIDSTGNVIIAGTSQRSAGRLSIDINPAANNGISFYPTTNTGIDACRFLNNAGSIVGTIVSTASATSYVTSSDYRLKENITPMTGALATVQSLKPVTYKWKVDGSDGQGFIAHELQAVVPDCVTGEKDAVDDEGKPVYQGIDTSFLVATLTAAIQEQTAIIQSQADTITAMELRLTALEVSSANASGTSVTQENK
jgi:hypothetical protein